MEIIYIFSILTLCCTTTTYREQHIFRTFVQKVFLAFPFFRNFHVFCVYCRHILINIIDLGSSYIFHLLYCEHTLNPLYSYNVVFAKKNWSFSPQTVQTTDLYYDGACFSVELWWWGSVLQLCSIDMKVTIELNLLLSSLAYIKIQNLRVVFNQVFPVTNSPKCNQ